MIVVNPTGGGLSGGKLAQATATIEDVSKGKTFYAGDYILKAGISTTAKFKSGSFTLPDISDMYPTMEYSISIGFRPTYIVIQSYYSIRDMYVLSEFEDGRTYLVARGSSVGYSLDEEWGSTTRITATNNGFVVDLSVLSGGTENGWMFPFSGRTNYYYAVGY